MTINDELSEDEIALAAVLSMPAGKRHSCGPD